MIECLNYKIWPAKPVDYSMNVSERWAAMEQAYRAQRNAEPSLDVVRVLAFRRRVK